MKWLILIALISCGQKNPPAKDVRDSDGDQIPNYLETDSELQKYVAEVIPFAETKGSLTFKLDSKYVSVNLSNEHDIAGNAMKLLTKTLSTIKTEDYFSEWSILKAEATSYLIPDGHYDVTLALDTTERPDLITLTDGKAELEVGNFANRLEFRLTAEELRQILLGKLHLNMKKNPGDNPYSVESTIRDRTYRVFYFDGKISKIHYVSHELEFSRYLRMAGIEQSTELKNFRGFSQNDNKDFWWTRNVGEKDKIVVKSSLKDLSQFHVLNFTRHESQIDRTNGSAVNSFIVTKSPASKFVIKFRGNKIQNVINETSRAYNRSGARGEFSESCRQWGRTVVSQKSLPVTKEDLLSGIIIQSQEKSISLDQFQENLTEGSDEKGWYLELALDETPKDFTILLAPRSNSTYVKTGVYQTVCDNGRPVYSGSNTNEEGQMNIKIESFIEKID